MILQHQFPFQLSNRTCVTALSVCLHVSDPISTASPPLHPYPSPCVPRILLQQQPSALQKVVVLSAFSNSLPHCKNQGYSSTFEAQTKQERSFGCGKEKLTIRSSRHNIHIPPLRLSSSRVPPSRLRSILYPSSLLR